MNKIKITTLIFCGIILLNAVSAEAEEPVDESNLENLKSAYNRLKEEFKALLGDRDNLREQAKFLLQYKNEILNAQQQLKNIETERVQWELEKQSFKNRVNQLERGNNLLNDKIAVMEMEQIKLQQERDDVRMSLSKTKTGQMVIDDLKRQVSEQKKENSWLEDKVEKMKKEVEGAADKVAKAQVETVLMQDQLNELKGKYKKALDQNSELEKKLEEMPKEFAEVARENKILIKRTALMHYNLGVFYTKSKEYTRAIAEFEKAVELNTDDGQSYFNLGYIYAEFLEDRPKAIEYFQKYLRLAKKGDKDVDWVKKYILTWQTWEGEK